MFRKLLAGIVLLALPVLVAAQAPAQPRGIATQVQGDVASPAEPVDGQNNQHGADEVNGQNHDGQHEDNQVEQGGVNEPDGPTNEVDTPGNHASQTGQGEGDQGTPAAPPAAGHNNQVGRHKP
jgi:hypothetical protein